MTDNNGCLFIDSVEITQPTSISVSVNSLNVSCFGYNDGFIEVNVNSGSVYRLTLMNGQVRIFFHLVLVIFIIYLLEIII